MKKADFTGANLGTASLEEADLDGCAEQRGGGGEKKLERGGDVGSVFGGTLAWMLRDSCLCW